MSATHPSSRGRNLAGWLGGLPTLFLLLLVLLIGSGELVHGRLLEIGQVLFGDRAQQVQYYALRADPTPPHCDPQLDVDAELARLLARRDEHTQSDVLERLINEPEPDAQALRDSLRASLKQCLQKYAQHEQLKTHITTEVKVFRAVEQALFDLFHFGAEHRTMIALLLMGVTMLSATVSHGHISLVAPRHTRDYLLQSASTALASGMLLWSSLRYFQISSMAGVPIENTDHHIAWIALFTAMLVVSLAQCRRPRQGDPAVLPGSWTQSLKTLPVGSVMTVLAGTYYALQDHPSGLAIYVHAMASAPFLPLHLALFIWCGMLFKQTRMIDLFMNLLRPWRLSPEFLTYVILLAAALPTAYTGGSGAFVMAAGGMIYHEVRSVGGSGQYALAASAMSGSLGVVLRPSLLVVAIVAVNNEVTSEELFRWGNWVFLLTSTLFFLASRWRAQPRTIERPPLAQAWAAMWPHVSPMLSHVALIMAVLGMYEMLLDTPLTETSAPLIMPVLMVLVVAFDQLLRSQGIGEDSQHMDQAMRREESLNGAVRVATSETVTHLGGYVFLILLSQAMGGVIDRSNMIHWLPLDFGSPYLAMCFVAVALVALGMFMEPLGAIFLVSSSLAPVAYANGIQPVHFWMTVLVAFELGYLTPPVALNQLLARRVVGEDAILQAQAEVAHLSFYWRHERWVLPCAVMAVALLIVAFVPLSFAVKH
jgi:TRAP-type C4-dicarboxylate transport system permease large subunit